MLVGCLVLSEEKNVDLSTNKI